MPRFRTASLFIYVLIAIRKKGIAQEQAANQENDRQMLPLLIGKQSDKFPEKRVRVEVHFGFRRDPLRVIAVFL